MPYLGYFALIKHSDQWVVFDTPQFPRHGWIERNRILKPQDDWQYIKIPLIKFSRDTAIKDVVINQDVDYQRRIFAQIEHYKKKAPYYNNVIELMTAILAHDTDSIVELNIKALKIVCDYIGIPFHYTIFSDFKDNIPEIRHPDEWALEISKFLNASTYYNLPGGKEFFNFDKFKKADIDLRFFETRLKEYDQKRDTFKPALSIIDVMMFNSQNQINNMLDDYNLTK